MSSILATLHDQSFTPTEERIASFILKDPVRASLMTSTEISNSLEVSNASIIRFTRTLGFDGYSHFKAELQKEVLLSTSLSPDLEVPLERLGQVKQDSDVDRAYAQHLHIHNANLQSIEERNDLFTIEGVAQTLAQARRVYLYGSRSRAGIMNYVSLILSHCLSDVYPLSATAEMPFDALGGAKEGDVFLLLSFSRYSALDQALASMAKSIGMTVILMTESRRCPSAEIADEILFVDVRSETFYNSYAAAFFLFDFLCARVSSLVGRTNEERLRRINDGVSILSLY